MKTRNTITKLIAITMVVAALVAADLLGGAGLLQPVQAQIGDGSVKFVSYASTGIVSGQKVRLSVANSESRQEPSHCRSAITSRMRATHRAAFPFMNRNGYKCRRENFGSLMFGVRI